MNKFLFVTHITPRAKRSSLRQSLIDIYYTALNSQQYPHWKVIVLGEEEKTEGKFHYFLLPDGTREEKFDQLKKLLEKKEIKDLFDEADYIIKLDDDDIISPNLLERLKDFNGDLFYDRFHTFLDSTSGRLTQQERNWVASTCVHKKEHALAAWSGPGSSPVGNLLYSDHSKSWHEYYKVKNSVAADPAKPVYIRVLSPTSITSGALNGPPQNIDGISFPDYYKYLRGFGEWPAVQVNGFENFLPMVSNAWQNFAGRQQENLPVEQFPGKKNGTGHLFKRLLSIFRNRQ